MSEHKSESKILPVIRSYYERKGVKWFIDDFKYRVSTYKETKEQRFLVSIGEDLLMQFAFNFNAQSMFLCFSELFSHIHFDLKIYFISRMLKYPAFQEIGTQLAKYFVFRMEDDTTEYSEESLLEAGHLKDLFGGMTLSERRKIAGRFSSMMRNARMPFRLDALQQMRIVLEDVSAQRGGDPELAFTIAMRAQDIEGLKKLEEQRRQQIAIERSVALRLRYTTTEVVSA